jgi:hypothetical protein
MSYPQLRDRDLALSRKFGVTGTPDIIVLSADDTVLYRGHRPPADWNTLR